MEEDGDIEDKYSELTRTKSECHDNEKTSKSTSDGIAYPLSFVWTAVIWIWAFHLDSILAH